MSTILFDQNVTDRNVKEVRDLIQAQLGNSEFAFVESRFGSIEPPVVKRGVRLNGPVLSWGTFANEGYSGFQINTTDCSNQYNSHSSGLVSVDVKIEEGVVTISYYEKGVRIHHQYIRLGHE